MTWTDVISQAATALGGAFFGAWCAFRLQRVTLDREEVDRRAASANRFLFQQVRQINTLRLIQKQYVDPVRDDPSRYLAMQPYVPASEHPTCVDIDSLSFLLQTEHRGVLLQMSIEQERYEVAIQAMRERGKIHLEEVQRRLEEAGFEEGKPYPQDEWEKALGRLGPFLRRLTDDAIEKVDLSVDSLAQANGDLCAALKSLFPKKAFIKVDSQRTKE